MDFRKNLPFESDGVKKPFSCTFGINEGQKLPEAKLVGQVLLERLAIGSRRHKTSEIGGDRPLPTDYSQRLRGIVHACVVYTSQ